MRLEGLIKIFGEIVGMQFRLNIEGPEYNEAWHNNVVIYHRKLSTYINTLIEANFIIEKVIDVVVLPTTITEDELNGILLKRQL